MGARGLALAVAVGNIQSTSTLTTQCMRKYTSVRSRPEPCQRLGLGRGRHEKVSNDQHESCQDLEDDGEEDAYMRRIRDHVSQCARLGRKQHRNSCRRGAEASQQLSQRGRSVATALSQRARSLSMRDVRLVADARCPSLPVVAAYAGGRHRQIGRWISDGRVSSRPSVC
jgi:hypothetical protein